MRKILILGVAAVQKDAIMELKKLGYETFACAMKNDGPGAEVADHFEEINILNKEEIIEYIKKNEISLVYSVGSDLAMPVVGHVSEVLDLPLFVSERTALICNNKNLMRETLGKEFVGNVSFQVMDNFEEQIELEYPFILKPADSQGQRGVKLVESLKDFLESFKIAKEFSRSGLVILEQYIGGPEVSVNGYLVEGKLQFLEVSDRETWPEYTGLIRKHIVPSVHVDNNIKLAIRSIVEDASLKLGINNGPVYVQMKIEDGVPYIIEITPRLDGCHMWNLLQRYTGINLLKLTFDHLINNDINELQLNPPSTKKDCILEFICQAPNTPADFTDYKIIFEESDYFFKYYNQDENIRSINGKYDKIGYFIYSS